MLEGHFDELFERTKVLSKRFDLGEQYTPGPETWGGDKGAEWYFEKEYYDIPNRIKKQVQRTAYILYQLAWREGIHASVRKSEAVGEELIRFLSDPEKAGRNAEGYHLIRRPEDKSHVRKMENIASVINKELFRLADRIRDEVNRLGVDPKDVFGEFMNKLHYLKPKPTESKDDES